MKKLLLSICLCGTTCSGLAQAPRSSSTTGLHTPRPSYPPTALAAKVTGSGMCQVVFNGDGRVTSAVMTKSTGTKVLDENTMRYARANWMGHPNTTVSVPIEYKLAPAMAKARSRVQITGKQPPYPYQAIAAHTEGNGVIKVSFDETGKVVNATMSKSTGSDILDQNTIKYVTDTWHIDIGRKSTMSVPIIYRLVP